MLFGIKNTKMFGKNVWFRKKERKKMKKMNIAIIKNVIVKKNDRKE